MSLSKFFTLALAAMALIAISPGAHAEQGAQNSPAKMPAMKGEPVDVSEAKLEAYADSAIKVGTIQQSMAPQIKQAGKKPQKKEIFQQMQKKMIDAIRSTEGISVQEYNKISMQARQDENLAGRIQTRINKKMQ